MSQTITQGRLRIDANFKRFVDEEVLPGTGLDAAAFWRNFDEIVHDLARQLRDNKMNALESGKPEMIVTANIGCQTHLASAGRTSVRHWIEIVEQALEKE